MASTVLVVEDERKLRDLVRSYLERAGFTVLSTDSGAEAITMALTSAPDLVILDLGLPDVPGRDRGARTQGDRADGRHADPDADGQGPRRKTGSAGSSWAPTTT
jgi:CheY-like chemotaxis protein